MIDMANDLLHEGGVEIFGFADLANFSSVLRFPQLKLRFLGFGVLRGLRVFSNLIFGFSVFVENDCGFFTFFLSNAFSMVFLVLLRKLHPVVALKL